eukprot:TRINITY_DN22795_c0_g1_i1.p1 TRINITY_DN22795_c0_g1~~TRINITY_DN22795_c0_g1_i1.p1  ORF type:complete len:339 (+),score=75.73 TRINITY_DN22795_c0_g1_i1:49-1065(+)
MSRRQNALERAIEAAERTAASSKRLLKLCQKQQDRQKAVDLKEERARKEQLKIEEEQLRKNEETLRSRERQQQQLKEELLRREDELLRQIHEQRQRELVNNSNDSMHSLKAISPIRKTRTATEMSPMHKFNTDQDSDQTQTPSPSRLSPEETEEDWNLSPAPRVVKADASFLRTVSPERPHSQHLYHRNTLPPGNDSVGNYDLSRDWDASRLSVGTVSRNKVVVEDTPKWNNSHQSNVNVNNSTVIMERGQSPPPVRDHLAAVTKAASTFLSPPSHIRDLMNGGSSRNISPNRKQKPPAVVGEDDLITRDQLIARGILKTFTPVRNATSSVQLNPRIV